jgi:hypothetical protein
MQIFSLKFENCWTIAIWITMQGIAWAQADDENPVIIKTIRIAEADAPDVSVMTGIGSGTFQPAQGLTRSFGGLILGVRMNFDNTPLDVTPFCGVSALIDGSSNQVIRQSFSGGLHYYLIGGKKRTIYSSKIGDIAGANASSVAFTLRSSQDNYSITPSKIGVEKLQGGVLNLSVGVNGTFSYSDTSSLALEFSTSLLAFAASIEKATASATDITMSWRTFL